MQNYKKRLKEFSLKVTTSNFNASKILSSRDAYDYIKQFYADDIDVYESFFLLLLNRANNTTGYVKISQGGTAGTVVDMKIIAKYAIDTLSASVILAHNHPSGNVKPSQADRDITKKAKAGLELLDVCVLDHIILTSDNGYHSFADEGLL